jgi:hypothetical protein
MLTRRERPSATQASEPTNYV